jgi:hypothetical protein
MIVRIVIQFSLCITKLTLEKILEVIRKLDFPRIALKLTNEMSSILCIFLIISMTSVTVMRGMTLGSK